MGKQKKNDTYLGRGIHNEKFKKSILNGNLKQMLAIIKDDSNLDVQIRKDYLNIYYRGGSIAKVNSEKSVVFDKFYFYSNMKETPKNIIEKDAIIVKELTSQRNELTLKFKEGKYKDYFEAAKTTMSEWLRINPKPEREDQHQLSIENLYNKSNYTIIDLEYQVSTLCDFKCLHIPLNKDEPKNPRFDIIAINKQGELCVIELKKGIGALKGTSGLKEHWDCYKESIGRNYKPFMIEMGRLLEQKQAFNIIDKQLKIKNSIPKFMFAYSYDDKNPNEEQDKVFQIEYNKIGIPIPYLILSAGTFNLLD